MRQTMNLTIGMVMAAAVAGAMSLTGARGDVINIAASGNYSATATWSSGTVPTSSDDLGLSSANAKTVKLDDGDHTVSSLSTDSNDTTSTSYTFQSLNTTNRTLTITHGITKSGNGALFFGNATNTLTLSTPTITINAGNVTFQNSQTFGTAGSTFLTMNGGEFRLQTNNTSTPAVQTVTLNGDVTIGTGGSPTFRLTQLNNVGNSSTLTFNGGFKNTLASGKTMTFMMVNAPNGVAGVVNLNGASDDGAVGSIVYFGGGNNATGVQYKNGVLNLGHDNALPANAVLNLGTTSNFNFTSTINLESYITGANTIANNVNVYGYTSSGGSVITESYTLGGKNSSGTTAVWSGQINLAKNTTLTAANSGAKVQFSNVISGAGQVTIGGAGVVELAGGNSYSGGTKVSTGSTLLVNNATGSGTGSGNVVVDGTLGGSGTISGAVTVNGILAPGNSPGTLTITNALTLADTATSQMQLGESAYDRVAGVTDITFGGTLQVTLDGTGLSFADGQVYDLFDWAGNESGAFSQILLPTLSDGLAWKDFGGQQFDYSTGQIVVVSAAVPEAGTVTLLGIAAAEWMLKRRKI